MIIRLNLNLPEKYEDVLTCIQEINEMTGMNINAKNFLKKDVFSYNRGRGLVKRPELPDGQPHSSLALLIIAVSEKDDENIIKILKEEVNNLDGGCGNWGKEKYVILFLFAFC